MKKRFAVKLLAGSLGILWGLLVNTTLADPTEIFLSNAAQNDAANVLFVLDNSGSMLLDAGGKTRMQVMQESLQLALKKASADVNVGLMRFGGNGVYNKANGVSFPISPIDAEAYAIVKDYQALDNLPDATAGVPVRDYLATIANSWVEFNGTPLVDALYEAVLYFRGMTPNAGFLPPAALRAAHPTTYTGAINACTTTESVWCLNERGGCPDTKDNCSLYTYQGLPLSMCLTSECTAGSGFATYKSPITEVCQKNFIVLMTDGEPSENAVKDKIKTDIFNNTQTCQTSTDFFGMGECGPELTQYLAANDQSASIAGTQGIETFTIGFGLENNAAAQSYLQSLASPGGAFYQASNAEQLTEAFQSIIREAEKQSLSVSAPAYTLSSSNHLANGDEVFIPVFDSTTKPLWSGNLRKFKLLEVEENGIRETKVVGKNNVIALDDAGDGRFEDNAQDLWSTEPSGNNVTIGGAASLLDPAERKLWTDLGDTGLSALDNTNGLITTSLLSRNYNTQTSLGNLGGLSVLNLISLMNSNTWWYDCSGQYRVGLPLGGLSELITLTTCTKTIDEATRTKYLKFIRGYAKTVAGEISDLPRKHIGDILHSKPVVYNYASGERTVFVGSNEGFLHAFNADTGVERWAFMPNSLLKNIGVFFDNNEKLKHVYGVDGQIRIWVNDVNKDGTIGQGEGIYIIFGLGRGGSHYYMLDVTNPNTPALKWHIDNTQADFANLGETWSKPALATMKVKARNTNTGTNTNTLSYTPVLVFGAGYDANKDEQDITQRAPDTKGLDVYIIDALEGKLLWSLKNNGGTILQHSVAGDIRVLDMDRDGSLDRLYFADTGGYVWRADIATTDSGSYTSQVSKLADLGGNTQGVSRRMFFAEPDVALQISNGAPVLTIALGSGYKMHPLSTAIADRFYVLKDDYVYTARPSSAPILKEDVNVMPQTSLQSESFLESDYKGWYIPLAFNGEKSVSKALTFMGKIIFSTFALTDQDGVPSVSDGCSKITTTSRVYVLDLMTGDAVSDLNRDGAGADKFLVITNGDILESPQLVFKTPTAADGSACKQGDCQQLVEVRVGKLNLPLLDKNNTSNTSLLDSVDLSKIAPRMYWLNKDVSPQ
ncbi:MAG: PilC/PilY family type IV pilus protein [Thiofilum sp.]|uniref:PilC/PilY family type IV pilus protein n=1 Tax=Thiofilum sp. TaxID=2212733 RepID=UPI0025DD843D|nr:PilC/PilY family type IV pilus protein [Thiofilum sp.]MBK8453297.1 PQQ-binding-like beta-propeller repeat protein [Thiofilum sp.]